MQSPLSYLLEHKGFYFINTLVTPEYLDSLEDFETRDSDVYLVTYPKSGTVWCQNILSLIYYEGHRNGTENIETIRRVPWLEYKIGSRDDVNREPPRLFATHLPYDLAPKGIRNGKAKVIYVTRNPKDIMVSLYHFCKFLILMESIENFDVFMERFLNGKVLAGSWLDHTKGWCAHKDDDNVLFLTYEEMKMDLRGSVLKICNFLKRRLTEEEVKDVVDKATFDKMKMDPRANYCNSQPNVLDHTKGTFLRKGTIGDWKNTMTVAQSERFDSVFKERMEELPIKFCWDINDKIGLSIIQRIFFTLTKGDVESKQNDARMYHYTIHIIPEHQIKHMHLYRKWDVM